MGEVPPISKWPWKFVVGGFLSQFVLVITFWVFIFRKISFWSYMGHVGAWFLFIFATWNLIDTLQAWLRGIPGHEEHENFSWWKFAIVQLGIWLFAAGCYAVWGLVVLK